MPDPDDATLAAYQSRVQEYLRGTPGPYPELTAFIDRFASLAGQGPVLELGSGPGRDADYLEGRGVQVIRTDATPAFVDLLRDAGHDARLLDARTDPLGGPYQGIFANAVLLHLSRDQFEDLLQRARAATAPDGVLAFTLKEGDGEAWTEQKLGLPRHFTYWREPAVRSALHRAGWPDASIAHVAGREDWLHVLAHRERRSGGAAGVSRAPSAHRSGLSAGRRARGDTPAPARHHTQPTDGQRQRRQATAAEAGDGRDRELSP